MQDILDGNVELAEGEATPPAKRPRATGHAPGPCAPSATTAEPTVHADVLPGTVVMSTIFGAPDDQAEMPEEWEPWSERFEFPTREERRRLLLETEHRWDYSDEYINGVLDLQERYSELFDNDISVPCKMEPFNAYLKDENDPPTPQKPRRMNPAKLRCLDHHLRNLQAAGVIQKYDGPCYIWCGTHCGQTW